MDWRRRRRPTRSTHSVPIIGATNEAELRRRESGRGHGCMPCMHARAADGIDAAGANVGLSSRYSVSSLCDVLLRGLPPTSVGLLGNQEPKALQFTGGGDHRRGNELQLQSNWRQRHGAKNGSYAGAPRVVHHGETGRVVRPSGWERKKWA